jgi:carbonic anhydrase/acetyltransferase-like protein (isoleucine patch superfamily)
MNESKKRSIISKQVIKGKEVFIAPTATVLGDVKLGDNVSVWFSAVMRGDTNKIRIGDGSNIQDNVVVHCDDGFPAVIGEDCIIGHGAIVHGAVLGNNVLVGMNATVLNGAEIGDYCIISANSLVTGGTKIPPHSLVVGNPGKVVKTLSEKHFKAIRDNAKTYRELALEYLEYYKEENKD